MANIGDLSKDILLAVLSLVPAKDLILNCRLVCRQWKNLVDSTTFWKFKLKEKILNPLFKSNAYYALSHLEKNLIKNPCGQAGLEFWEIVTPEEKKEKEGQWTVQAVSGLGRRKLERSDFLQRNSNVKFQLWYLVNKCFAVSKGLCIKSQYITLKDHGYWDHLMDEGRPTIVVTDWFFWSFSGQYEMTVKLLTADMKVVRMYNSGKKYKATWQTGKWYKVSHTFYNCPPGIRHILFQHQGKNLNEILLKERIRITKTSITIGPYSLSYDHDEYSYVDDKRDYFSDSSNDIYHNFGNYSDDDDGYGDSWNRW